MHACNEGVESHPMQYKAKGDTDSQVSLRVGFTSTEGFRRTLGLNTRTCRGHGRQVQAARRNEWAHLPFPLPLTCKHDPAPYPLSPYPPSLPSLLTLSLPTLSLPTLTLPALSITCKHEPCSQPELGEGLPTLALQQVSAAMQSARHSSRMVDDKGEGEADGCEAQHACAASHAQKAGFPTQSLLQSQYSLASIPSQRIGPAEGDGIGIGDGIGHDDGVGVGQGGGDEQAVSM